MKQFLSISMPIVLLCLSLGLAAVPTKPQVLAEKNLRFGILLATDKASYRVWEPITFSLRVFNATDEPVVFYFRNAQRYDFTLEDSKGKKLWRWGKDRMFAMALGEERLAPGKEMLVYKVKYEGKLAPGMYKATGLLVAKNRPMSASLTILIQ